MENWNVTKQEKEHLRALAKKQLEYSKLPIMEERIQNWYNHNDLKGKRPMVYFETSTCEMDLLPPTKCTSDAAKHIELQLLKNMINHECIDDDTVVSPYFPICWETTFSLFDIKVKTNRAVDSSGRTLGHEFIYAIKNLQEDIHSLKSSTYQGNKESTLKWKAFVEEILGDILPVKITMGSLVASLSQKVVHLMGMENMMFAIYDYPDEFKELMKRITEDHINYFKWLQKGNLLLLNNGNDWLGQGSFGFTKNLPSDINKAQDKITTNMLWGYMDSQETVSISPEMFGEFFFPYYKEVGKYFGLLSYGCCEPVNPYWKDYISKLPNLRKISISPWCDEEYMGNEIQGKDIIYLRKPSPNFVGVGKYLDEDLFREHILKTIKLTKGCHLEFSFRDVYTLNGNKDKPRRAVEIVRELIEDHWE